jgi:hypothetical protein
MAKKAAVVGQSVRWDAHRHSYTVVLGKGLVFTVCFPAKDYWQVLRRRHRGYNQQDITSVVPQDSPLAQQVIALAKAHPEGAK